LELNHLDRHQAQYVWAMQQWLTTPGLTAHEQAVVNHLLTAAYTSVEEFDAVRRVMFSFTLVDTLNSAIAKARHHGLLKEWPSA